ncbi:protein phosphatase 1 regulatory subunit 37 [Eublepharis macularius]|uniref:Protein phosphatase 1 regulatory subunit 37 n=1 Tax=Eublepharis macularius TaxID=481883 RepID=A0AA97LGY2_EUBMA|nr:protein phosphatase 1 regulatory subunit 37 [Eublepharis macularius]
MRREEGAPPFTNTHFSCPAMECMQVPPMQQQGKAAEGDRLLLLLPPPDVLKEDDTVQRASDAWASSQEDSSQGRMKLQDSLDFSSHLQNPESLHSLHNSPALGSQPDRGMVNHSATKEDLQETCDEAGEQLHPAGKDTSSLPVQEDLLVSEVVCGDASLATGQECLRDAEKSPQQNSCLQEKSDSPSQNCILRMDATASGESPQDDPSDQASPSAEDGKLKPGAKHVTFPSDEDIVSGAVEPKDPWRHAQNVTVEEILTAYKQACQKLNCKQIPKLLKQIQEFKDLTPRIDCLDLKGEKLDYKTCEALEEIFKRLQFKIVDLEQTNLDEDGASALFDMIEYYESATHLNISFNKHIGTRGWQAAAHMMRKTNCLQYLDARNTPLLDHSAPFVARALRISNSLAVLHLENASLSGRPLMLLATALKMNVNLRELYLADNKLNSLQDSAQLGNLLKFNCSIQILDLRNNHILDSGLAYVCEGLKEQRKGLVTLVLWNNQLTHTGMAYMGVTLPHMQSLETLNLGHNPIGNEGVRNLKNGLIGNRSVLRLGLASTKLTCEGAVAVAEFIAESPRLLRLDLRENEIKTGGLMALSLALKVNHSLLRLDLDREPKKESVKSFIETQKALLTEIQNGCKRNFVLAKEKEEKEQKLRQSASMPEITVTEPLEEGPVEDGGPNGDATSTLEEGEEVGEALTSQENGAPEKTTIDGNDESSDSDSDTDEEDDEKLAMKDLAQPQKCSESNGDKPAEPCSSPEKTKEAPGSEMRVPPLNTAEDIKCDSSGGLMSGAPAQTSPPGNERRIAVSSPGRGHKIFVVTRVESLPEKAEEKSVRQEGRSVLQAGLSKQASPLAQTQLTKTDCLDRQAGETAAESTVDSETPASVLSSGLGAKKVNSGLCTNVIHNTTLPNGLKTEFVHALPDASLGRDCKMASCSVEHELSCSKNEKELEELLLEASLEMGQEPM